jgi:hypothetical protein
MAVNIGYRKLAINAAAKRLPLFNGTVTDMLSPDE